jgi:hypothetical protein
VTRDDLKLEICNVIDNSVKTNEELDSEQLENLSDEIGGFIVGLQDELDSDEEE